MFVDPGGLDLSPGQVVVAEISDGPRLATVVVGAGQLVERPEGALPTGRVLRIASQEEIVEHGRRAAADLDAPRRAAEVCTDRGQVARAEDAWLSPDGSVLEITLNRAVDDPGPLARDLGRAFGLPVRLSCLEDGRRRALTGPSAAGLPEGWADWLAPPGAEPTVSQAEPGSREETASEIIDRLFPAEERPVVRRSRRSDQHG